MSMASNVLKKLARQKSTQPKREEIKRPTKKGESMATLIRTSPKPTYGRNFNQNANASKKMKVDDSPSKKGKKRSILSMMMMLKGYLMS